MQSNIRYLFFASILFLFGISVFGHATIVTAANPPAEEVIACLEARFGSARALELFDGADPTPAEEPIVLECFATPTPTTPPITQPPVNTSTQFTPLTNLPGLSDNIESRTLADYINVLYRIAIGLGAMIAVIKITYAGILYMGTDSFSSKETAKKEITSSLLGLLLMLSTVLILGLIYPKILIINVLDDLPPVADVPSVLPPGTVADGQPCDGVSKKCASGPEHCIADRASCARIGNIPTGICMASCTPSALKAPGEACESSDQCANAGTYNCKFKTYTTTEPPKLTGCRPAQTGKENRCLDTNCKP